MNTNYVKSFPYENYIKLARLCNTDEFGAHNSYMLNLMDKEEGGSHVTHLKEKKLIEDVKKYMTSATKFALKRKIEKEDKNKIKYHITKIKEANTSKELLDICKDGIEVLVKYKLDS